MIQPTRLRQLNEHSIRDGKYVLYWMQASQRTRFNHALEYAIGEGNKLGLPVVVGFGLMDDYPEANARHYAFMLEGLADVHAGLKSRGIQFVLKHGQPAAVAILLAKNAALVVCDRGYQRHQKAWRDEVADDVKCRVVEVESDVVVPVEVVSDKQEYAARTIRPKIHKLWGEYLVPLRATAVKRSSLRMRLGTGMDVTRPGVLLKTLKLDWSVRPSGQFLGGEVEAGRRFKSFIGERLKGYDVGRNEPAAGRTSMLSGYLHFGQISPLEMALAAMGAAKEKPSCKEDADVFLEELIVRRELAMNFVNFCPRYDAYEGLPAWARKTLAKHATDKRYHVYSDAELEAGKTHDKYWNAAQLEMTTTGFMHNYMRMYWGKKVLEWGRTPEGAHKTLLWLNNRHFLCGRDPNAYANVGWIFGLHDRPWGPERPVFGLVRYMNEKGLERKFDMEAYVRKVEGLRGVIYDSGVAK